MEVARSIHMADRMMIRRMVVGKPVVIFSRSSCCMSHSIEMLIRSFGASPTVYELDQIPNGNQIERALQQMMGSSRPTAPAVFIAEQFVGGDKELFSLNLNNQLPKLLIDAGAIFIWNNDHK